MRFRTTVELGGRTATGFAVPDAIVEQLAAGRRPAVRVTVGAHTYRSTVARMGGRFLVPLSRENREAAGVAAGDEVEVELKLDDEPRTVAVPADLHEALAAEPAVRAFFDGLSYSAKRGFVDTITLAKKPETRARRIERTLAALREGRKR